jgi:hypothetical protein
VCRRPSAGNRLTNPGFDGSFSGWTPFAAVLTADSEACPSSNSVYVDNSENDPQQCIALTPGGYYFGGRFNGGSAGNFFRVRFYTGASCTGGNSEVFDFFLTGYADWTASWQSFSAPPGTMSASVYFLGRQQYFDQLYLSTTNSF